MIAIGESIHVIAPTVRAAVENRDRAFIQDLAKRQVAAGADVLDLNIGPQKKAGPAIMDWIVRAVQEAVDVPLSLDTTNTEAIEAGLKAANKRVIINSTDATDRLNVLMPLAAKYDANIIALTYGGTALPTTADARIELAMERIMISADEHEVPTDHLYLDPLVLTVNGNQDQIAQTVESVRFFKQMSDPPPWTTCGLSNVSNSCPKELRPLLNQVFLVMMLGAGLDAPIMDAFDEELVRIPKAIESRDDSTPVNKLYMDLYDAYVAGVGFDSSGVDMNDPKLSDIAKTVQVLEDKTLYAHGYLKL